MFNTIVLSGGSTRGYYQLGVLHKHEIDIKGVKKYIGTSVGGIICLLLNIGMTPMEILSSSLSMKCNLPEGKEWIKVASIFFNEKGILRSNPYITDVKKIIMDKYGFIPTMKQLKDLTGKELILTTACISTNDMIYISSDTMPDLPCTTAIDMSARIPILFTPYVYKGNLYVDGGMGDHFPIQKCLPTDIVLGIYTADTHEKNPNLITYFWSLANFATKSKYSDIKSTNTMYIYKISGSGGSISCTNEEAISMFIKGMMQSPV